MSEYTLFKTCGACPEQYDVTKDGKTVGYLRLRHGTFTVQSSVSGEILYQAYPRGDGCFDYEERDFYLQQAIEAIRFHYEEMHKINL